MAQIPGILEKTDDVHVTLILQKVMIASRFFE